MKKNIANWKTTLFGALAALGVYFAGADIEPSWLQTVGQVMSAVALGLVGLFASDASKEDKSE